jgi:hypothetical protein
LNGRNEKEEEEKKEVLKRVESQVPPDYHLAQICENQQPTT